jgi:hypothetical protein
MGFKMAVKKTTTPPAPPTPPGCDDYTSSTYWINYSGTYGPGGWTSSNDAGEDLIYLEPDGVWTTGFQPTSAIIYFTGVETVRVSMWQGSGATLSTLCDVGEYISGEEIVFEAWDGGSYIIKNIYIGNFPGTGQFLVQAINLCGG